MKNGKNRKIFTEKCVCHDQEGRYWDWEKTEENYETLKNDLMTKWDGWFDGVRIVKYIFNPETFEIKREVIKYAMRKRDENYRWVENEVEEG